MVSPILIICVLAFSIIGMKLEKRSLQEENIQSIIDKCSTCDIAYTKPIFTNIYEGYYSCDKTKIYSVSDGGALLFCLARNSLLNFFQIIKFGYNGDFQWIAMDSSYVARSVYGFSIEQISANSFIVIIIHSPTRGGLCYYAIKLYDLNTGVLQNQTYINPVPYLLNCYTNIINFVLGIDDKIYLFFPSKYFINNEFLGKFGNSGLTKNITVVNIATCQYNINASNIYVAVDMNKSLIIVYKGNDENVYLSTCEQNNNDGSFSVKKGLYQIDPGTAIETFDQSYASYSNKWILVCDTKGYFKYFRIISKANYKQQILYNMTLGDEFINLAANPENEDYFISYTLYKNLNNKMTLNTYKIQSTSICQCAIESGLQEQTIGGNFFTVGIIASKLNNKRMFLSGLFTNIGNNYNVFATISLDANAVACIGTQLNYFNKCMNKIEEMNQCHSVCASYITDTFQGGCLVPKSPDHCITSMDLGDGNSIQFVFPIRNEPLKIPEDGKNISTLDIIKTNCHPLCSGICTESNNMNKCSTYCPHVDPFVNDTLQYLGICSCIDGTYFNINIGKCLPGSCSKYCLRNECGEPNNLCRSCKNYTFLKVVQSGIFNSCLCDEDKGFIQLEDHCVKKDAVCDISCIEHECLESNDKNKCTKCIVENQGNLTENSELICPCPNNSILLNNTVCKKIISGAQCHPFCHGMCTEENNSEACLSCNLDMKNVIKIAGSYSPFKCDCAEGYKNENNLCVLTSSACDPLCKGKCTIENDSAFCAAPVENETCIMNEKTRDYNCSGCDSSSIMANDGCRHIIYSDCHFLCDPSQGCTETQNPEACVECIKGESIAEAASNYYPKKCSCKDEFQIKNDICVTAIGCHEYCKGACTKRGQKDHCVECIEGIEGIKNIGNDFSCPGCNTGMIIYQHKCSKAFESECGNKCNGKCMEKYRDDKCVDCKDRVIGAQNEDGTKTCTKCNSESIWNISECDLILEISKCHPLCSKGCTIANDQSACVLCKNFAGVWSQDIANSDLKSCSCKEDYELIGQNCIVKNPSKCGDFCEGCVEENDNTKCLNCKKTEEILEGTRDSDGIITCKQNPFIINFDLKKADISRCLGMEIVATIKPNDKENVATYLWTISYYNPNLIPNSFISALKEIASLTSKNLILPYDALAPEATIAVTLVAKDNTELKATKTKNFTIPKQIANTYCGPCQLHDRSSCAKLNGVCWDNYKSIYDTPRLNSSYCLINMASFCYKIWLSNGLSDSQCKEYLNLLDFTTMNLKPHAVSAKYVNGIGSSILIEFDTDINTASIHSCVSVLRSDTLEKLGLNANCYWISSRAYFISFYGQNEAIYEISLKSSTIFSSYLYAQASMDETTISVSQFIDQSFNVSLMAPNTVFPFSALTMTINPEPLNGIDWKYLWILEYKSGSFTEAEKKKCDEFFKNFGNFNNTLRAISIPSSYLLPNTELKVKVNVTNSYLQNPLERETVVHISSDLPTEARYEIISKGAIPEKLFGNLKNYIDINIKSKTILSNSTLKDNIKIWFEIRTGPIKSNLVLRGDDEKAIEAIINDRYQKTKILYISAGDQFKYYTYYKLIVYSQCIASNNIYEDSMVFMLIRKQPTCKISSEGFIFNPNTQISLLSHESTLEYGPENELSYYWNCEQCLSLISNSTCSCDIFRSKIDSKASTCNIYPGTLLDMSKYIISLAITLKQNNYTRSCYTTYEILAMSQAKQAPIASILQGYGGSITTKSDIYLAANIGNSSNLQMGIQSYEWTLLEIVNRSNPKIKYSNKNKYYASILKNDYNITLTKRRVLEETPAITTDITPRVLASPQSLPPVLGISREDLKQGLTYSYGLKLTYLYGKSPVYSGVNFDTPSPIALRSLLVAPDTGVEYQTLFTFTFASFAESDSSAASYVLYRKDCPLSSEMDFIPFTIKLKNLNVFSTYLAAGNSSCDYKVLIKLRVIVGDDFSDTTTTLRIISDSPSSKIGQITSLLTELQSNSTQYSFMEALSMLHQIALLSSLKTTANDMLQLIINTLTKYDTVQNEYILSSLNADEQVSYYELILSILFEITGSYHLNTEIINTIMTKVGNYIEKIKNINNGCDTFEKIVKIFDSFINFMANSSSNSMIRTEKVLYNKIIQYLDDMVKLKLKEIIPGGHLYQINTPNIAIALKTDGWNSFGSLENNIELSNQTIFLPSGLKLLYSNNTQKCDTLHCVISTVLYSITFNPYQDIKNSTNIDTSSLTNSSTINGKVKKETIQQIYRDLQNSTKLDNIVNRQKVYSKFMILTLYAGDYSVQSKQSIMDTTIAFEELAGYSKVFKAQISLTKSAANDKKSPKIPVYYIASNNSWSNYKCELNFSLDSLMYLPSNYAFISCQVIGFSGQSQFPKAALVLGIDSIEDFDRVAMAGNDYTKKEFFAKNAAPIAIGSGIIVIVILIGSFLHRLDNKNRLSLSLEALDHYEQKVENFSPLPDNLSEKSSIIFPSIRPDSKNKESPSKENQVIEAIPSPRATSDLSSLYPSSAKVADENIAAMSQQQNYEEKDEQEISRLKDFTAKGSLTKDKEQILITNSALRRYMTRYVEEKNCKLKETPCGFIIAEHSWLALCCVTSYLSPRFLRLITIGSVYIGELFIISFFFYSNETTRYFEDWKEFTFIALKATGVAIGLMLIIKFIALYLLEFKRSPERVSQTVLEKSERCNYYRMIIGLVLAFSWYAVCELYIILRAIDYNDAAIEKWLCTYLLCFSCELIVIETIKSIAKIVVKS